jgi:hypothetical protein
MERPLAPHQDQSVEVCLFYACSRLRSSFMGRKCLAPGRLYDGSAQVNDIADDRSVKRYRFPVDQPVKPPAYADNFQFVCQCGADCGTDAGIHARCVTAAR